jgi:hypothetical protein
MPRRVYLLFFFLGFAVSAGVAYFEKAPGYMDADYYYAGGIRLASGYGFTEMVLWNYLDDPVGLPHPSSIYWMPLASLLASLPMTLAGRLDFSTARLAFIITAASIPPLTTGLTWKLTSRRDQAVVAGFFAVFSSFYAPFFPTSDTFGPYMMLGGLFILAAGQPRLHLRALVLGLLAGLLHLARADGIIWLILALCLQFSALSAQRFGDHLRSIVARWIIVFAGYLFIMGWWFTRNLSTFGTLFSPGSSRSFWLTSYNQLFVYPASQISFTAWWNAGLLAAMKARLWALGINLQTAFAVQGFIFLFPFILLGIWEYRHDVRIRLGVLAWLLTFLIMTFAFPFAGARGGFFHSGAALQPLWWALASVGLTRTVSWAARFRYWKEKQAQRVFQFGAVGLAVLLTGIVVWTRVIVPGWGIEAQLYPKIEKSLIKEGASSQSVVIVSNPPGYYAFTGRSAIALPCGDVNTLMTIAGKYHARYLILEKGSVPSGLADVYYAGRDFANLQYLGEVDGSRIFEVP